MRVLGIETSSRRGTLAVVDTARGVTLAVRESVEPHSDLLLSLVEETLAAAGVAKADLDRVGVGIGPGSFTGVRVGVALAQGIALGLGRPIVGISSLRAMCRAVPADIPGLRCALLDARRNELFLGVFGERGEELVPAGTVPRAGWQRTVEELGQPAIIITGEPVESPFSVHRSEQTDLPHAVAVAIAASELDPAAFPAEPLYVRPADAIRPDLPRSPLSSDEPK